MYQTIIRDPNDNRWVRIIPNIRPVNGSILLVPPDTTAFFALNGQVSRPYPPGRHTLRTGVDPFFVRLRNLMTRGDPGISVTVFYVATQMDAFFQVGTGELLFKEREYHIALKAFASADLTFRVADPHTFLRRLVGMHSAQFSEDEAVEAAVSALVRMPIKESLSRYLSQASDLGSINNDLRSVSRSIEGVARSRLRQYGLELHRLDIAGINLPDDELQEIRSLQKKKATGEVDIALELKRLRDVYGDRLEMRMLDNMLSGRDGHGGGHGGDNMISTILTFKLLQQFLSDTGSPLSGLLSGRTDLFGGGTTQDSHQDTPENAPPPMPQQYRCRVCPRCGAHVTEPAQNRCPTCGAALK